MKHFLKNLIPQSIKNIYHLIQAGIASYWYGFPSKKLKIIGITGTDGKTTTANMIAKILEKSGYRVALASTINFRINGEEEINKTKFTTQSSFEVQKFLARAYEKKCEYVIIEVSSHALDQNRLWGIHFDSAVLTNITREHLDYHKTMHSYREAKKKLFKKAHTIILNETLSDIEDFLHVFAKKKITYGIKVKSRKGNEEYIQAKNIQDHFKGSTFLIKEQLFTLHIPGIFNIENALAAIATANALEINLQNCAEALSEISEISGRMEMISNDRGIVILIDYAVTLEALNQVYSLITKSKGYARIISVFGACGDRDRGKRPLMGSIVDEYADIIILTNEDPYWENPERIIDEIEVGIQKKRKGENLFRIFDRKEAIKKALEMAKNNDFVVITGKGAEETMNVCGKMIPWNDKRVVEKILSSPKKLHKLSSK
ncbi:MAG: UDP-N-acetylmuramoyl-L-alanyl-D-glutamate--2,6-diaminopimelate ligase [Candidatus Moraniibacteriota bacterium]|nr:MAG: UDP-N-acetylmuramoyl-L-alanyl-D-glutamate--2,6-diaminopimelate ligase [Candidatus Moranbacteria bacterium]